MAMDYIQKELFMNVRHLTILAVGLTLTTTLHAGFYKWTDDKGEVHYSETKPEGRSAKSVDVRTGISGDSLVAMCEGAAEHQVEKNGATYCCDAQCVIELQKENKPFSCATQSCYSALVDAQSLKEKKEREKVRNTPQRSTNDVSDAKKAADKKVIDECNARREIYCNGSADSIRGREQIEAMRQKEEEVRAREWNEFSRWRR